MRQYSGFVIATLLIGITSGCSNASETAAPVAEEPAPTTQTERPSPEAWSSQQAAASTSPEAAAAGAAAAGRAMGEACGFTSAEMSKLKQSERHSGAAFERSVEQQLDFARQQLKAQQASMGAAFKENCDFTRFMLENNG